MLVDRYSGYVWTDKLKDTSTATVTEKLNSWFVEYGYPEYIRTDGGPWRSGLSTWKYQFS